MPVHDPVIYTTELQAVVLQAALRTTDQLTQAVNGAFMTLSETLSACWKLI